MAEKSCSFQKYCTTENGLLGLCAGHVLRESSGTNAFFVLEGTVSDIKALEPQKQLGFMTSKNGQISHTTHSVIKSN